jgi:hypothetical protein
MAKSPAAATRARAIKYARDQAEAGSAFRAPIKKHTFIDRQLG